MIAWPAPVVPALPGTAAQPALFNTATGRVERTGAVETAGLYVCGITPYDATHLGHASTYLVFDLVQRLWLDAGLEVRYAQNVTDVDDPLLERAAATGVDWRELAESQVNLFRSDMTTLGVLPPSAYVAVTDVIAPVADAVAVLQDRGFAYSVATADADGDDVYFDAAAAAAQGVWHLGQVSGLPRELMLTLSAERGGDPERPGKRDPLDPLLWRAARDGEPSWPSPVGPGRPGWHIECSVIAVTELGENFTVQGGGGDLPFPHHEFSAGHAAALTGAPLAQHYVHAGLVAYQGEKMSKSLGNLVLVSNLTAAGVHPSAIRLGIFAHHYRTDWEWTDAVLTAAQARHECWRAEFVAGGAAGSAAALLAGVRDRLGDDLDSAGALALIDAAAGPVDDVQLVRDTLAALLGVTL